MTWPKHRDPKARRKAKAPYNFVPLPEKALPAGKPRCQDVYHADFHTGWLDCVLTTSSPLYVRCGILSSQFDKVEAKDLPKFFYTNPETLDPVIPGSSLRGMFRALVEIVSYSKVQPVTSQELVYRAVGDTTSLGKEYRASFMKEVGQRTYASQVKAGYLHRQGQGWEIIPASPISGVSFARIERDIIRTIQDSLSRWHGCRNAHKIYVAVDPVRDHSHNRGRIKLRYAKVSRASHEPKSGLHEGVLVQTGPVPRKHLEFVFGLPSERKCLSIPEEVVAAYRDQITDDQKKLLGDSAALRNWQPIFYIIEDGKLRFWGHAMMFRLPYRSSPQDFVPEALRDPNMTDLAEAMFGYVEPDENAERPVARAGRVFFSEATLERGQDDIWLSEEPITPRILASPKPTTFQHYLVQTEPDDRRRLSHYASPAPEETVIRGHKLYWHKGDARREDFEEDKPVQPDDTQHTSIEPVKSGVRFRFGVHFENLGPVELGALLWLLEMAADDGYRLKLGMGKPFGLGAVRVEGTLHLTDRSARYTRLLKEDGWATGEQPNADAAWSSATRAFEQWILSDHELNPKGAETLKDVDRIKMLCFLLSWHGPEPPREKTRYLEIQHPQEGNEYNERPVLPTPADVLTGEQVATAAPTPQRRPRPEPPPPPQPQTVSHPTAAAEIKTGDLLEGRVVAVEANRVVIDLGVAQGSMGLVHLDRLVQQDDWFKRMYPGRRLTARTLYDEGTLEEDIGGTRMQVRVHKIERRHGKTMVKLQFVAWLAEGDM